MNNPVLVEREKATDDTHCPVPVEKSETGKQDPSDSPPAVDASRSASTDLANRLPAPPPNDRRAWTDAAIFVAIHQHRGNLTAASMALGLPNAGPIRAYAKTHPEFKQALNRELELAQNTRNDLVIKTAYDLAIDGIKKREYAANGQLIRETVSHDAKHTAWMAERAAPQELHLPTRHEHTGAGGLPIRFKFDMNDGPLNPQPDLDQDDATEITEDADWDDAA